MTTMTDWYDDYRADGHGHTSAIKQLGRRIGVDCDTVARALTSAARPSSSAPGDRPSRESPQRDSTTTQEVEQ